MPSFLHTSLDRWHATSAVVATGQTCGDMLEVVSSPLDPELANAITRSHKVNAYSVQLFRFHGRQRIDRLNESAFNIREHNGGTNKAHHSSHR